MISNVSNSDDVIVFDWVYGEMEGQLIIDAKTKFILDGDGMEEDFNMAILQQGLPYLQSEKKEKEKFKLEWVN